MKGQGMATTAVILCSVLAVVVVCLLLLIGWMLRAWGRAPIEARALSLVMTGCAWVTPEQAQAILALAWGKHVQPMLDRQSNPMASGGLREGAN